MDEQVKVTVQSHLENTLCFRGVAYPPNESFKYNARECKHSSHYIK